MSDIELLIELLYAASQGRDPRLLGIDMPRLERLEHSLRAADQNAARERRTAEFDSDGNLVLLTR